ncbi:hypothetical protein H5410_062912 [Solanum commersonii]|uniref:Uncharacterized protein n=1 Tax=Solanum commersonii TaxID=4109 RepID=A0A9J5WC33_SOLCO|nr:hypothetical protein H5410_062912 [Solanum commersonii]
MTQSSFIHQSPAVAAIRRAKVDTELGDFTLPRGTELLIPIIAIHYDQTLWGQDANEFNPAGFGLGVAQAAKHPMAFMPFGISARRCVGQNVAVLQAKLAIAMILQRFSFDLSPNYQHAPTKLLTPSFTTTNLFNNNIPNIIPQVRSGRIGDLQDLILTFVG